MQARRLKKLMLIIGSAFLVSISILAWHGYHLFKTPILSENASPIIITLDRATSAYQFANILKKNHLIQSTKLLVLYIRFEQLSSKLKAGVYQIKPNETVVDLLHRVVAGDVITQNFSIIAGTTQTKIANDLSQAKYLQYSPSDWDAIKGNYPNAEGLLLADTYQYQGGGLGKALLEHAHHNLIKYLNDSWAHRVPGLPYKTSYELLIAASIIEKETAIPPERKLISGVMVNRLKKKMPLQMDPTIIYGLGADYTGKLSHNDMLIDSPYNSYRYRGLPPTPIATVGKEAIDAAAHPEFSNYLYFVAKGDGSHQFSETYEQQKQAINRYQRKDV